jgi:3-hydroxybutyrate dehydrogenase
MLQGKTAIVTGSTSGIGLGIAEALAGAGVNILFNGFGDAAAISALTDRVAKTYGVKTAYSDANVGSADAVRGMVAAAESALGPVDIVVNNAGIQYVAAVEDFPTDKWGEILAVNLSSAFYTTRETVVGMKARGWGRIINIASVHGLIASTQKSAYIAAKHGLIGLTKTVGLETAGTGVTCNAICPGWVLTPLVQNQIDAIAARDGISNEAATQKLLEAKQPSKQFATPAGIGAYVVFLCSDAAAQITGAAMTMDGGWTAQ